MKIPESLKRRYQDNPTLNGLVGAALGRIETHISANGMVFFPEYTDHSVRHVEDVLETAVGLITDDCSDLLTDADAAVLALAVGLHDLGMYLSIDGFRTLIETGSRWSGIPGIDKSPWSELWNNFLSEARRFDGKKLHEIFGDFDTIIRVPPTNVADWTEKDKLLIGEFLRRYHPRLAHEISVYGIPGPSGQSVKLINDSPQQADFLKLAGFVARSHGHSLRWSIDLLQRLFLERVNPRGVHAPFLMALLRIADYFQIQSSRAPMERTEVATLISPLSQKEWRLHQCIRSVHNNVIPKH